MQHLDRATHVGRVHPCNSYRVLEGTGNERYHSSRCSPWGRKRGPDPALAARSERDRDEPELVHRQHVTRSLCLKRGTRRKSRPRLPRVQRRTPKHSRWCQTRRPARHSVKVPARIEGKLGHEVLLVLPVGPATWFREVTLQSPSYAGPLHVAKHVDQIKVGHHHRFATVFWRSSTCKILQTSPTKTQTNL